MSNYEIDRCLLGPKKGGVPIKELRKLAKKMGIETRDSENKFKLKRRLCFEMAVKLQQSSGNIRDKPLLPIACPPQLPVKECPKCPTCQSCPPQLPAPTCPKCEKCEKCKKCPTCETCKKCKKCEKCDVCPPAPVCPDKSKDKKDKKDRSKKDKKDRSKKEKRKGKRDKKDKLKGSVGHLEPESNRRVGHIDW